MSLKSYALTISGLLVTAALGVWYITPLTFGDQGPTQSHVVTIGRSNNAWTRFSSRRQADFLPADPRQAFRILRSRPERIPGRVQKKLDTTLRLPAGALQFRNAQYAKTQEGGFWLIPGHSMACIVHARRAAVGCAGISEFVKRGAALGIFAPPKRQSESPTDYLLLGVAPNWAKSAQLRVGKVARTVSVSGNIYAFESDRPILLQRLNH